MKHTRLFAAIAIAVVILAATGTAGTLYVSPDGSASGDGTIANPFDSVMAAYAAACSSADYEMVFLQPGTYVENGTLILSNSLVALRGCGADLTSLRIAIVVTQATSIADMELYSAITNDVVVFLDNVKLNVPPTSPVNIIGVWQWSTNSSLRVRGTAAPEQPTDAVPKSYVDGSVTGGVVDARYVRKSGDTISGALQFAGGGSIQAYNGGLRLAEGLLDCYGSTVYIPYNLDVGSAYIGDLNVSSWNTDYIYSDYGSFNGLYASSAYISLLQTSWTAVNGYDVVNKACLDGSVTGSVVDARYVRKSGDTMTGGYLTLANSPVSNMHAASKTYVDTAIANISTGDWHVGSASEARHIVMENDSGFIMAKSGSGFNLRLKADDANGGQIVMHSPVAMPGMAGRITGVNTQAGYVVSNSYCRESSVVAVTKVGTSPLAMSVVPANDYFTVYGNTSSCEFTYLIINP